VDADMSTRIATVGVIGAGTMGHALALVHALGGMQVRLQDSSEAALARAPGLIDSALATLVEAEAVTAADAKAAVARIGCMPDLAQAVTGVDLVVEAIVESPEAKREIFARIDAHARDDALIASNTSHLDIFDLVPAARARTTLIAHWYTPPYIVDLVDLVGGPGTDPAAIERLRVLYDALGKKPVVMRRFISGYIANRIQSAIGLEVYRLLDEGYATAEDIDTAVIHGLALRMPILGFLRKADFTGLDMVRRALANRTYEPPVPRSNSETLDRLLAEGRGGVMSGRGFFDYRGCTADELFRARDRRLLALKRHLDEQGDM
jgi:3-hydroxybutyryl-CoA dehydrogenase